MKRRDIITILGFLSLGGVGMLWRNLTPFWRADASEHLLRTVAAIADLMIPGDELPAASQFGLHTRILELPELKGLAAGGVSLLDKQAVAQGAADFLALDDSARLAALDAAFASRGEDAQRFLLALRFHLMTAYYSEAVVKAAFAYTGPPQPAGFVDFQDSPT
jgi:hypothetical protein